MYVIICASNGKVRIARFGVTDEDLQSQIENEELRSGPVA
jgi:hypothetical protein